MNITDKKRTLIFINIIITCIASSMLATALNTALPNMMKELSIDMATGQWLTSGYSLIMGIMMPLTAFLITRFPTRKLYISAVICFLLGLVLCAAAPDFSVLMSGRALQACGNGILTSMAQVIILSIFPNEKKGTAMGWYGLSVGAAPVIAPTLAGMIVDVFGWRMIFYIAAAIMILSLVYAICVFDNVLDTMKKKFDVLSFVISAIAFGGITLGIGNIGSYSFVSVQVLWLLGIGIVAAVIFSIRQFRLTDPFLELRILSNKDYTLSVIGSMLLYFVMMGSSLLLPLYVQSIMGRSATLSGIVMLPGSLAMAIISPFAGKIYDRLGMKLLFVIGAACMMFSNAAMMFIHMDTPIWLAGVYNTIRCMAIGCLMMPLVTWGTSGIELKKTAHATALLTSLRTIAGAVGQAISVGVMTAVAAGIAANNSSAMLRGFNASFLMTSVISLVLLLISVFGVKRNKTNKVLSRDCR
ncbi:MAG: multidrug efflux MFS transporter [Lachnospiraceae bacterium]|nr:multidrug efflux MFS transporter [Lachnospiraceae bacterium]